MKNRCFRVVFVPLLLQRDGRRLGFGAVEDAGSLTIRQAPPTSVPFKRGLSRDSRPASAGRTHAVAEGRTRLSARSRQSLTFVKFDGTRAA